MCYRDAATLYLRYRVLLFVLLIVNIRKIFASLDALFFFNPDIALVARSDSVVPVQK